MWSVHPYLGLDITTDYRLDVRGFAGCRLHLATELVGFRLETR